MNKLLTAEQMKRCDSYTIETLGIPSRELMQRAADGAFDEIMKYGFDLARVLCVCGTGNNGGDGLAVAMLLHRAGVNVAYYVCGDTSKMTPECAYRYEELRGAGVPEQPELDLSDITLIVDAILGIGISGDVRDGAAGVIQRISDSKIPVAALDIPSGINSDTGAVMGCAVKAELTVSFAYLKPGHIFYPGRLHSGKTVALDIGIGMKALDGEYIIQMPNDEDVRRIIPKRSPDSHKGTYGRLLVVAGSEGMCGAAYFSALAGYRTGSGLVEVFTVSENLPVIQMKIPEAIATASKGASHLRERISSANACVIGPGLGKSTDTAGLVSEALGCRIPLLIDADGLNLIADSHVLRELLRLRRYPTVVTPHLGEMARLCGASIADIQRDPVRYAVDFARKYGVICVMKSAVTVITDGAEMFLNPTGCTGMSKGGSGDVLAGVIGALLGMETDPISAAVAGVYLHGRAGETASAADSEYSLLATDIANSIGKAINGIL